jgi:hypothetical protein
MITQNPSRSLLSTTHTKERETFWKCSQNLSRTPSVIRLDASRGSWRRRVYHHANHGAFINHSVARYVHPTAGTMENAIMGLERAAEAEEQKQRESVAKSLEVPTNFTTAESTGEGKDTMKMLQRFVFSSACRKRPGGETGRRTGLKIPSSERNVPVQFRSRAPLICACSTSAITDRASTLPFLPQSLV